MTGPSLAWPPKILFLHIPGSAGTSLTSALERLASPRLTVTDVEDPPSGLAEDTLAPYRLITGHFYAHQTEVTLFEPFLKITVLRDPLERFISCYNVARQAARSNTASMSERYAAEVSAFEYFMSPAGVVDRQAQLYVLGLDSQQVPEASRQAQLLERARERLETMVVAVTPKLSEVVARLYALFGATGPAEVPTVNATPPAHGTAAVSEEEVAMMRRILAADYALYAAACQRCEDFIANPRLPLADVGAPAATAPSPQPARETRLNDE
jgi:hypothetical protein